MGTTRSSTASHPDILSDISTKKALDDDLRNRLKSAIKDYKADFLARAQEGTGGDGVNDGECTGSTATHPQREEHAADHQGHEDGLGGKAAPGAGSRDAGAPVCADADQRAGPRWYAGRIFWTKETGNVMHPLLVEREEKSVLVVVIAGDKGFAGGFNSNIGKAAQRFIDERRERGQNIDLEPVGQEGDRVVQAAVPGCGVRAQGRAVRQRSGQAHRGYPSSFGSDGGRRGARRICW